MQQPLSLLCAGAGHTRLVMHYSPLTWICCSVGPTRMAMRCSGTNGWGAATATRVAKPVLQHELWGYTVSQHQLKRVMEVSLQRWCTRVSQYVKLNSKSMVNKGEWWQKELHSRGPRQVRSVHTIWGRTLHMHRPTRDWVGVALNTMHRW